MEDDQPCAAGVELSFSERAVIFEDAYTNAPGEVVARRSTMTKLSCTAHGGPRGARLSLSLAGSEKLVAVSGPSLPLSASFIPPGQKLDFEIEYEGLLPSEAADDIVATATLVEEDTNERFVVTNRVTSVRIQLEAVYEAPENPNPSRHVYGVGEKVRFSAIPELSSVVFQTQKLDVADRLCYYELFDGNCVSVNGDADHIYVCPISANYHPPVKVKYFGVEYFPSLSIVDPQYVVTPEVDWCGCHGFGDVGQSTLVTTNYIGPMTVSFQGIMVAEIPCSDEIEPTGYFASVNYTGYRSHTIDAEAGRARRIQERNRWTLDEAGGGLYLNWSAGRLEWKIPIGWGRLTPDEHEFANMNTSQFEAYNDSQTRPLLIGNRTDLYMQIMLIDEAGTSKIEKFGHWLSRGRHCRIILDGETKQWTHFW